MDGSAVRTDSSGDVAHQFHLSQSAFEIGRGYSADQGVTFVASYLCLISANHTKQAAAVIGISEVSVWNDRTAFDAHS